MKKTLIVVALAVVLTFMFAAAAFADHSPTFYVKWDKTSEFDGYAVPFGNSGTGSPHQNYLEGTEKCAVCHSVHRAPVYGMTWDTSNDGLDSTYTWVAGKQYKRAEWNNTGYLQAGSSSGSGGATSTAFAQAYNDPEMLLMTNVASSCDYCHILTAIGGDQLYAGKPQYRTEGTGLAGAEWDAGFAHHNGCTGCHAVHGVSNSYGDMTKWGEYGTFQGPIKSKVLKVRAKGSGGTGDRSYEWQEETIHIGAQGKADMIAAGGAYATWATAQTAAADVPSLNVPLFPSTTAAINGTSVRPDASAYDAQSGVFCTFCHVNYGWASEATNNPDHDRALFQGPWNTLGQNTGTGTAGRWYYMNSTTPGDTTEFKNHPVKPMSSVLATAFAAQGKSATVPSVVAWANASTCVSCHDAGLNRPVDSQTGVWIESYPHFTPGYFHFVKSASHVGDTMDNGPVELGLIPARLTAGDPALTAVQTWLEDPVNYEESTTVQDGMCLKCHVAGDGTPATGNSGVGLTF